VQNQCMRGKVDPNEVSRFLDAWFAVRQLIQAANFNHFSKAGLSATQFMTLNLLPESGEAIAMGDLARRMNLKPATVAKTVDSLEARQLLARERSPEDGRVVLVRITGEGSSFQNAAAGQFRRHISKMFSAIPPADRAALIHGLESLVRVSGVSPAARGAAPASRNTRRSPQR